MSDNLKADRERFLKRLPLSEKNYRRNLRKVFRSQEKEVLDNIEKAGIPKGKKVNFEPWISKILFQRDKADTALLEVSGAMWEENIETGADDVASLLGLTAITTFASSGVTDFIRKRSFDMLEVNKTTVKNLRKTLVEGLEAGEGVGQIRSRITAVYSEAIGFRSERIARTEVASAQNFGRTQEMELQNVERKVWITAFSNSRGDHIEADGQVVPVDSSFIVGGEDMMFPGDPSGSPGNTINCQCSVSPTLDPLT